MIDLSITIHRPVDEVFAFYLDFGNLPRFLGDVVAVQRTGTAKYRWTVQGPVGIRASWTVRVTEVRANELICYQTVGPPGLITHWEIHFLRTTQNETGVREVMKMPLGMFGRAALALAGKCPGQEVRANLRRLKQLLETGEITDTSYAVEGKFSGN